MKADDWNAGTGNWFINGNWLDGSVPTAADNVDINNAGTAQVGAAGAVGARLRIGHNGTGNLNISNGGTVNNTTGFIGNLGSGNGAVIVDGVGSIWTNSSFLRIGQSGTGSLSITNGGIVTNTTGSIGNISGSNGTVTVDGADSVWTNTGSIRIGEGGTGSLSISNGSSVSNTFGRIGNNAGSNGSVTVNGAGSSWTNSSTLFIGRIGTGNLNISNGGMVSNTTGRIGNNAGSNGSVTVDGAGSAWTNSGTLEIGNSGTGSLSINDGGMVSNTTGDIGDNSGSTGTVTVDGTASTWTNSGFLRIGQRGTGNLSISNGGIVTNTTADIGNISGSNGTVTVDGAGSVWTNTGSIRIGDGGTGNLSISDGGVVNSTTVTLANSGGSTGTFNIGTGGSAGILNTALVNGGAGTATLNFNHTDTDYFFTNNGAASGSAVAITGSTAVNHIGSGTTTLTGVNTYTGPTIINNGTLLINGSNSNSTNTINSGGTLGGIGTVGTTNINNGGIFAPGNNSIGTTNVAGNAVFNAGSNYNVEVNAAGNSDLISVTGIANLTGGAVNVQAAPGAYLLSTDYTILTSTGGLGGTIFNNVNSNLAFLDPTLSYDANNVFLNLTRNSTAFNSIAGTPNQIAVSTALDSLTTSNPAAVQDILNNLLLLTGAEANRAFDSLSGVQHTHSMLITQRVSQRFLQLLLSRSNKGSGTRFTGQQNFSSASNRLLAYNGNDWASLASAGTSGNIENTAAPQRGLWLSGFGGFGNINHGSNASGVEYDTGGVAFGADHEWRDFVLGIAGSYARSDADTFGGDMNIDSYQAGAYGSWQKNTYYVNTMVGFGAHKTSAVRTISVGPATSTAKANYYTYTFSAATESGKDIALSSATTLTPFIGLDYIHSNRNNFTEAGAGTANLNVSGEDLNSLKTNVGLKLSHEISIQKTSRITPYTTIAYVREHLDRVVRLNGGFAGAPTTLFRISGSRLDRDRLRVGVGVAGQLNERTSVNLGYYGDLADSHDIHSISATGRYIW